jgi:hypothetical protein
VLRHTLLALDCHALVVMRKVGLMVRKNEGIRERDLTCQIIGTGLQEKCRGNFKLLKMFLMHPLNLNLMHGFWGNCLELL